MLTQLYKDTNIYRISIYNRDVRSALKSNSDHYLYADRWALAQGQSPTCYLAEDSLACQQFGAQANNKAQHC